MNYSVTLDVCQDDIDSRSIPYSAYLMFSIGDYVFGKFQHDFGEYCVSDVSDIIVALQGFQGNHLKQVVFANGSNEIFIDSDNIEFRTCYFGHETSITLPVNQSLIDAYLSILEYHITEEIEEMNQEEYQDTDDESLE